MAKARARAMVAATRVTTVQIVVREGARECVAGVVREGDGAVLYATSGARALCVGAAVDYCRRRGLVIVAERAAAVERAA